MTDDQNAVALPIIVRRKYARLVRIRVHTGSSFAQRYALPISNHQGANQAARLLSKLWLPGDGFHCGFHQNVDVLTGNL
ncbi:hypothetical protein, partial [Pseudomonas savastanoi]